MTTEKLRSEIFQLKRIIIDKDDELAHKEHLMVMTNNVLFDEIAGWKKENEELKEIIKHLKEVKVVINE